MPIFRGAATTGVLVAAVLAAHVGPVAAQRPDTLVAADAAVRMWSRNMQWNGREGSVVRWLNQDTLIVNVRQLENGRMRTGRYMIPVWELDTLQMLTSRRFNPGRFEESAIRGGLLGLVVGTVIGVVGVASTDCPTSSDAACSASGYAKGAGRSGLAGGLIGAGVGVLLSGYGSLRGEDKWLTIAVPRPAG